MSSQLYICIFPVDDKRAQSLSILLSERRYRLRYINKINELIQFIEANKEKIDCLVFFFHTSFTDLLSQLANQGTILPMVIVEEDNSSQAHQSSLSEASLLEIELDRQSSFLYHSAEVRLERSQLEEIPSFINLAVTKFLHLAPACTLNDKFTQFRTNSEDPHTNFLLFQQRRLADKLKERLGYLGVYYKRNPQDFYRNLSTQQKQDFLAQLNLDYRQIILSYFAEDGEINQLIDRFVNKAFFADFSVAQILEIHMELMDEFSQQLKLEGRSPFNLLFGVD